MCVYNYNTSSSYNLEPSAPSWESLYEPESPAPGYSPLTPFDFTSETDASEMPPPFFSCTASCCGSADLLKKEESCLIALIDRFREGIFSVDWLRDALFYSARLGKENSVKWLLEFHPPLLEEGILKDALIHAAETGWPDRSLSRFNVVKLLSAPRYISFISEVFFVESLTFMFQKSFERGDERCINLILASDLAPYLSDTTIEEEIVWTKENGKLPFSALLENYQDGRSSEPLRGRIAQVQDIRSTPCLTGITKAYLFKVPPTRTLRKSMETARKIIHFCNLNVPYSSNFVRRNPVFREGDQNLIQSILDQLDGLYWSSAYPGEKGVGNCQTLSEYGFNYAVDVLRKEDPDLRVEMAYIERGDHVFLVINRVASVPIEYYAGWGPEAVICDPWSGSYYPAGYLPDFLYDFIGLLHPESVSHTMVRKFNPGLQKIKPLALRKKPVLNRTVSA